MNYYIRVIGLALGIGGYDQPNTTSIRQQKKDKYLIESQKITNKYIRNNKLDVQNFIQEHKNLIEKYSPIFESSEHKNQQLETLKDNLGFCKNLTQLEQEYINNTEFSIEEPLQNEISLLNEKHNNVLHSVKIPKIDSKNCSTLPLDELGLVLYNTTKNYIMNHRKLNTYIKAFEKHEGLD